jgi:hypothetical protein
MNSPYKFTDPLGLVSRPAKSLVDPSTLTNDSRMAPAAGTDPVVSGGRANSTPASVQQTTDPRPQALIDLMQRIRDRPAEVGQVVIGNTIPQRNPEVVYFTPQLDIKKGENAIYNMFDASKINIRSVGASLKLTLNYSGTNNVLKGFKYSVNGGETKTAKSGVINLGSFDPVSKLFNEGEVDPGFIKGDVNKPESTELNELINVDIGGLKSTINITGNVTVTGSEVTTDIKLTVIPAKIPQTYYKVPK